MQQESSPLDGICFDRLSPGLCVRDHISSTPDMINVIYKKGLEFAFPQIWTALHPLIVAPINVAYRRELLVSCHNKKNHLRSITTEDRLNTLLILSIEFELEYKLSFDNII